MENNQKWLKGFTFKKNEGKHFKNSNGNEFAVINLGKNAEGKNMYFSTSTKLISNYNMATDGEHKFQKSNLANAPFIAIAYPEGKEMIVSVRGTDDKYIEEKLTPADVKKVFKEMTSSTSNWVEKALASKGKEGAEEEVKKVNSSAKTEEVKPTDIDPEQE